MFSCHVKKSLEQQKKETLLSRCAARERDTAKDDVDDADVNRRKCCHHKQTHFKMLISQDIFVFLPVCIS